MIAQRNEDGTEGGKKFFGGGVEMAGRGGEKDKGPIQAGDERSYDMEQFVLAGRQGENRGNRVPRPRSNLVAVVETKFGDFKIETEGAAEGAADFGPVEFPGDALIGQDGVFAAVGWIALANAGEGAVVAGNNFMGTTAFPRTRNELSGCAGFSAKKEGGKSFEVRLELVLPDHVEGGAAGDRFERGPKAG